MEFLNLHGFEVQLLLQSFCNVRQLASTVKQHSLELKTILACKSSCISSLQQNRLTVLRHNSSVSASQLSLSVRATITRCPSVRVTITRCPIRSARRMSSLVIPFVANGLMMFAVTMSACFGDSHSWYL